MTERIAEFLEIEDAQLFLRAKGKDSYHICGGIDLPYAVRPKEVIAIYRGPYEPPDYRTVEPYEEDL